MVEIVVFYSNSVSYVQLAPILSRFVSKTFDIIFHAAPHERTTSCSRRFLHRCLLEVVHLSCYSYSHLLTKSLCDALTAALSAHGHFGRARAHFFAVLHAAELSL